MDPSRAHEIAVAVLEALDGNRQRAPFSSALQGLSTRDAYAVTAELRRLRTGRGEAKLGRKIGFTNRNIWPEYGVYEPIWGDMYDTTVHDVAPGDRIAVMHLPEPRIEPEIVFGLRSDLRGEVGLADVVDALDWVAHGFEFVQSIYPDWAFKTADTIAKLRVARRALHRPETPACGVGSTEARGKSVGPAHQPLSRRRTRRPGGRRKRP